MEFHQGRSATATKKSFLFSFYPNIYPNIFLQFRSIASKKIISEYICYLRYWTNDYRNIFGMIKRSRMNVGISLLRKINEYFYKWIYLSKIFQYIWISDILSKQFLDYLGNFYILCYFGPIFSQLGPIINIKIFLETMKIQIYLLS